MQHTYNIPSCIFFALPQAAVRFFANQKKKKAGALNTWRMAGHAVTNLIDIRYNLGNLLHTQYKHNNTSMMIYIYIYIYNA